MQINDVFNLVLLEKFCVFIVIAIFVFFLIAILCRLSSKCFLSIKDSLLSELGVRTFDDLRSVLSADIKCYCR